MNHPPSRTPPLPRLGLVCITHCEDIRYKMLTRARFLTLSPADQRATLTTLYAHNLAVLDRALAWCSTHNISLYRVTSALFPFSDEPLGIEILHEMTPPLARIGQWSTKLGIRVVVHPDQFVVLSSDSPDVIRNSITVLERHALAFDLMGLPISTWSAMNIHGGKGNRHDRLVATIRALPDPIRLRLTLENDESAYGAPEIYEACLAAGVPMVFDAHHHLVREKLASYEDPSIREWTDRARATWAPHPDWQLVHLSNGAATLHDQAHHDTIFHFPSAFLEVPWVEIEAKTKESAIADTRRILAGEPPTHGVTPPPLVARQPTAKKKPRTPTKRRSS